MNLESKVALVTGSARRVGKAIALALAREGASIVLHYGRSIEDAQQTQTELEELGVQVFPYSANLADPDQIVKMFESIRVYFGRLDVLVNSAASFTRQPFDEIELKDWVASLQVNLRAPFLCTQQAARLMRESEREAGETALIVNIADLSGVYPWKDYVQHGISKAGLLHLTKITARELAPDIRVNAVIPGAVLPPPGVSADSEAWQRAWSGVPLGRPGDPAHVGQTVVFFARNDYVTGVAINVDGGEHLVGPGND
jgi:NAD(P)-dependent dehydrogenase (short-subunit alcohol dehydrogenase family)